MENAYRPVKKKKAAWKIILIVAGIIAALYLFATFFTAIKFNSLNPIRTGYALLRVTSGSEPYMQVASVPYEAYVTVPGGAEDYLDELMADLGYERRSEEQMGASIVFGKDSSRIRVTVSGNEHFSRWVFSQPYDITNLLEQHQAELESLELGEQE